MTTGTAALDFIVQRSDLHVCKCVPAAAPGEIELQSGQVLLSIDKFAFTSNNVTYAAFGEAMSYWNFFPAPEGWGRIPVWGFGDVIQLRHEAIKVGERFYGYFPMSTHVVVQPDRVSETGFFDGAPHRQALHRQALHAVYNQYLRITGNASGSEDEQMLLRPLFMTSFLIDDFLADNEFFGARAVVLSSASSKTAYGTAFLLAQRKECEVIGLTSSRNVAFTRGLGCYHRVVTYDDIASLPADRATVYVDMAGAGEVRGAIHHHFGDNLKYSCAVGGTHWDELGGGANLPGPRPTLFFAPAQIKKRSADWGPGGVQARFGDAWRQFLGLVGGSMRVVHGRGPAAVERVYQDMLAGRARPDEGHVLSLAE